MHKKKYKTLNKNKIFRIQTHEFVAICADTQLRVYYKAKEKLRSYRAENKVILFL